MRRTELKLCATVTAYETGCGGERVSRSSPEVREGWFTQPKLAGGELRLVGASGFEPLTPAV